MSFFKAREDQRETQIMGGAVQTRFKKKFLTVRGNLFFKKVKKLWYLPYIC